MLELNKIHHGDCSELMKEIPDKSIDVVITDPPYGILGGSKTIGGSKLYKTNEYNLDWDNERMNENIFKELQRISNNQIIFGYNYFSDFLPTTNSLIVWDKKEKNNWFDNFSDFALRSDFNYYTVVLPVWDVENDSISFDVFSENNRLHPLQKLFFLSFSSLRIS